MRLVEPEHSPVIADFEDLADPDNAQRAMDDFIAVMNLGVKIAAARGKTVVE